MINKVPLVSILIPLFNKEAFIESTIASALDQVHEDIEVLVIDDGSTDGSLARALAFTDPRLLVRSRENLGGNSTRNELIEWAKGEYIQFLDADDLLDRQKISRQLECMRPEIDLVTCRSQVITSQGSLVREGLRVDELISDLAHRGELIHAPLHRRANVLMVAGFHPTLSASQEYEFHLRSALLGVWKQVATVDDVLVTYRHASASITSSDLRVYRAKAEAIRSLLPLARNQSEINQLAHSLMNAGRHLARSGERSEAASVIADALVASPAGSATALPRRTRWLRRRPALLAGWEGVEGCIRYHLARIRR